MVEDDYLVAQEIRRDLEAGGAAVAGPVPSVERALRLLEEESAVDAAVLDVNLGGQDSFPIARALEARSIPFLFSTGYNSGDIPAEWRNVPVVMKPLQIAAVESLLSGSDAT